MLRTVLSVIVPAAILLAATLYPKSRATADEAQPIKFEDLRFEIKKDEPFQRSMLGKKIEALDGKTVAIRGWMTPDSVTQLKGNKSFVLVYDNMEKGLWPNRLLTDCITVEMK